MAHLLCNIAQGVACIMPLVQTLNKPTRTAVLTTPVVGDGVAAAFDYNFTKAENKKTPDFLAK